MKNLFKKTLITVAITGFLSTSPAYALFGSDKNTEQQNIDVIEKAKHSVVTVWKLSYEGSFDDALERYEQSYRNKYKDNYTDEAIEKALTRDKERNKEAVLREIIPSNKLKDYTGVSSSTYFKNTSVGSGIILDSKNGYILTNNHVISGDGYRLFLVQLDDGRLYRANIIGNDEKTDLALLQIENIPEGLSQVAIANSDELHVGQTAIAMGSPSALVQTVTQGIISALDRAELNGWDTLRNSLDLEVQYKPDEYVSYIQTDTAINGGNSGGPLLNSKGELIGINSAGRDDMQNTNFAIPSNIAVNLIEQFKRYGFAYPGRLGVEGTRLNSRLIKINNLPEKQQGIIVNSIDEDSPVRSVGMLVNDVITKINGRPVTNEWDFRTKVVTNGVDKELNLTYLHQNNGKYEEKTVALKLLPAPLSHTGSSANIEFDYSRVGFSITYDDSTKRGCKVTSLKKDGMTNGFLEGDIIKKVNNISVSQLKECSNAIDQALFGVDKADVLRFTIERNGNSKIIETKW